MKIRTQLVVALILLAVVPLSGLVLYSYVSSTRALREAVETKAAAATREMEQRMAEIETDLSRRVERAGSLWQLAGEEAGDEQVVEVISQLGEVAPLLRSFEFVPAAPPLPPAGAGDETGSGTAPPEAPALGGVDLSGLLSRFDIELSEQFSEELESQIAVGLKAGAEAMRRVGLEVAREVAEEWRAATERARAEGRPLPPRPPIPPPPAVAQPSDPAIAPHPAERHELRRLHRQLEVPLRQSGELIGSFRAQVSVHELLGRVLGRTRRDQGEIPFAIDQDGELITLDDDDRRQLAQLPIRRTGDAVEAADAEQLADWVVVTRQEPSTGLSFGIARPIRESLEQVRRSAVRNLGWGLALIFFALAGILPISRRMTRGLKAVTEGAERIAQGDLKARVPVEGRSELGQLANAFNRMAYDLEQHQEMLVEGERQRRDQEVRQQLLEAEYRRKTDELEEARRFQLSLLPRQLPEHPSYEVAVSMRTATEVGGDYYDFRQTSDGVLVAAVGDATGHGAKAGTMVTVIKSLFSAYPPKQKLAAFLAEANRAVRRMELGRMAMALCLARLDGDRLTLSSAGMPPALVRRAGGGVEEFALAGMPLGGLEGEYDERGSRLEPGDLLLLMSDGLPELPNADGEPLGYRRVRELVAAAPAASPRDLIDALLAAAREWAGEGPPNDDITFVAIRVR